MIEYTSVERVPNLVFTMVMQKLFKMYGWKIENVYMK